MVKRKKKRKTVKRANSIFLNKYYESLDKQPL